MKKTRTAFLCAVLASSALTAQTQEAAKPPEADALPGRRLRVQFLETRQKGEAPPAKTPVCTLILHADGPKARVFVGSQVPMTTHSAGTATTTFRNAGLDVEVAVTSVGEGRYRLDARLERGSPLPPGTAAADANPILRALRGESRITLREGETIPLASAADSVTGEMIRIDVVVAAAPVPKTAAKAGGDGRLGVRLLFLRKQGEKTVARRPYSVTLQPDGDKASVFSGSMLPVQTSVQGQPTVMLKDVGAGLRLTAHRIPDGRYRLDVSFSDGVVVGGAASPRVSTFQSEARVFAQEGETVTVATAADPETGDLVEAAVTVESVR
jgi:hypothetical protein